MAWSAMRLAVGLVAGADEVSSGAMVLGHGQEGAARIVELALAHVRRSIDCASLFRTYGARAETARLNADVDIALSSCVLSICPTRAT